MWEQAWFLDQFGVLHDGKQPYPGAITTCMFSIASFGILVRLFVFLLVITIRSVSCLISTKYLLFLWVSIFLHWNSRKVGNLWGKDGGHKQFIEASINNYRKVE